MIRSMIRVAEDAEWRAEVDRVEEFAVGRLSFFVFDTELRSEADDLRVGRLGGEDAVFDQFVGLTQVFGKLDRFGLALEFLDRFFVLPRIECGNERLITACDFVVAVRGFVATCEGDDRK